MPPCRLPQLCLCVVLVASTLSVRAQTLEFVVLMKQHWFTQTDSSTVVEKSSDPWEFRAMVSGSSLTSTNPISSSSVNVASGSTSPTINLNFSSSDHEWRFTQLFSAQTGSFGLNETFASGTYTFNVGAQSVALGLSGDTYPNNPMVTASAGTWSGGILNVDPTQALTLTTNTFSTNFSSGQSRIGIDVSGSGLNQSVDTQTGGFTATFTSMSINANQLTAGQYYDVTVEFNRFATMDNSTISGVMAVAAYTSTLQFQIYAISAIPEPATYTAIIGGLALLGVAIRRRFRFNPRNGQ